MTNEEVERTIEFILKQQVQFATDVQLLAENQVQMGQSQVQMGQFQTHLANVMLELVEAQTRTEARLTTLTETITEMGTQTDKRIAELTDSIAHTDQKLDALIDIVREQRNGKAQGGY